MLPSHATYLRLIRDSLENTVLPAAGTDFARLMTKVSSGLLARMLVEANDLPAARQTALAAYASLLPELETQLNAEDYAAFEQALAAAPDDWTALEAGARETARRLIASGRDAAACAARIVAIDFALRDRVEAAFHVEAAVDVGSGAEPQTETFTETELARLVAWLEQQFAGERGLRIAGVKRLSGGASKLTMLIVLEGARGLPTNLVLRCERAFSHNGPSIQTEFPLLTALHDLGVPVPKAYALEATGEVVGSPFLLMDHLTGRNIGDFIQVTEPSPEVALDYARALALLHRAPVAGLAGLVKKGELSTRQRVGDEIDAFERDWKALPKASFVMDCAYDWLRANLHLADGHRALVHRDVGAHNMLVAEGKVTALLDWERCTTGNPAEDLGCIYYMVGQMIDWDRFMARYEEVAGFRVPREQIDFYTLWGSVRLATMITRANIPILEGRLKHLHLAFSGEHFVQRLLHRVSGKLAATLGGSTELDPVSGASPRRP